jgi:hypothetical protein
MCSSLEHYNISSQRPLSSMHTSRQYNSRVQSTVVQTLQSCSIKLRKLRSYCTLWGRKRHKTNVLTFPNVLPLFGDRPTQPGTFALGHVQCWVGGWNFIFTRIFWLYRIQICTEISTVSRDHNRNFMSISTRRKWKKIIEEESMWTANVFNLYRPHRAWSSSDVPLWRRNRPNANKPFFSLSWHRTY